MAAVHVLLLFNHLKYLKAVCALCCLTYSHYMQNMHALVTLVDLVLICIDIVHDYLVSCLGIYVLMPTIYMLLVQSFS